MTETLEPSVKASITNNESRNGDARAVKVIVPKEKLLDDKSSKFDCSTNVNDSIHNPNCEAQIHKLHTTNSESIENQSKDENHSSSTPETEQTIKTDGFDIRLYTLNASNLLYGRRGNKQHSHIDGLVHFRSKLTKIYLQGRKNYPYAWGVLYDIEFYIKRLDAKLTTFKDYATKRLNQNSAIDCHIAADWPEGKPFWIRSQHPYGYMAARLLVQFDEAIRHMRSAEQLGLIPTNDSQEKIRKLNRRFRQLFVIPGHCLNGWQDVTTDDLEQNTIAAQKMIKRFGKIHPRIVKGELHPQYCMPLIERDFRTLDTVSDERMIEPPKLEENRLPGETHSDGGHPPSVNTGQVHNVDTVSYSDTPNLTQHPNTVDVNADLSQWYSCDPDEAARLAAIARRRREFEAYEHYYEQQNARIEATRQAAFRASKPWYRRWLSK